MAAGADRTSSQALLRLRVAVTGAVTLWVVADLVEWGTGAPPGSTDTVVAHTLHLLGDATFIVAVWALTHSQRPVRQRGELIETLLVLLGVTVPLWLLWVRPNVAQTAATTAGGAAGVAIHQLVLFALVGFVIWYVVGDVWIDRQSEALRAVLVMLVVLDLGPPFPGGGDPIPIVIVLEVLRLALALGLAVATYRQPDIASPRPVGRRHWQPDRVRLLTWAVVALVGPVVLAGGVMAGTQDLHVIAVALGATVVGVALLSLREWTLLQDVGTQAGRQQRRAERHATLTRRISAREDARTAFLRAASHDLRTPLMAIRGSAELLAARDEELDPTRRQLLVSTMNRNAERLEHMLASLLDVERLTAGTVQARHETVDVGEVARLMAALPHLRDEPIEVRPAQLPVQVDRLMVERIIENLVTNAVRHTPPQTPVWVDLERRDDGGVTLTVSDAGPGIAPDDRVRVFEAFARLEGRVGDGGSGLGLSLVNRFAALHDGTVHLDERPGGGARFVVELPGPGDRGAAPSEPVPTDAPPAHPLSEQLTSRLDTAIATAIDDEQVVDRAVRVMLAAETVEEVAGVLERVVRYLGGVPIRLADDQPLTPRGLDLALGVGPPVVPAAAPGTDARRRLAPLLPTLVDDAHRIGALLRGRPAARLGVPRGLLDDPVALRDHFLDLAVRGQVTACIDLAVALARSGEVALACDALLRPVQEESGRRWQVGLWTVVDEHLVTGIVDEVIGALETEMTRTTDGGRVALVCPPGEEHATAARLAALAWRCHGWQVRLLGIGVPLADLREHLARDAVDVLAVSCTTAWHLPGSVPLVGVAHELGVPTLLGGAALGATSERARRLGAAGWAPGALPAMEVLTEWRESPPSLPAPVDPHPESDALGRRRGRVTDRVVAAIERRTIGWGGGAPTLRDDVAILVRSTEASLQVEEPSLLDDVVAWMRDVATMRGLPASWPAIALEALVDALPDDLPDARRAVVAALRHGGAAGGSGDRTRPGPGTRAQ